MFSSYFLFCLLVVAAQPKCGSRVGCQIWNARLRVCVTFEWSQTSVLRVAMSAARARHPHSRVRARAQLIVAGARRNCGTFGRTQIWNTSIRVCVTCVRSQASTLRAATAAQKRYTSTLTCAPTRATACGSRVAQMWNLWGCPNWERAIQKLCDVCGITSGALRLTPSPQTYTQIGIQTHNQPTNRPIFFDTICKITCSSAEAKS